MPFLQVQLALNKVTHTCIYVTVPPHVNSKREIIKTSHVQIFLIFVRMERIRKGSDLPKKKSGGHRASNKNILTPS